MADPKVERILEEYARDLSEEELFAQLPPEARGSLAKYAVQSFRRARNRPRARLLAIGTATLSVAACLLIFVFWPRGAEFGLSVHVSSNAESLFSRGVPTTAAGDEFWVGVDVKTPAWIHVVERVESGHLIVIRLGPGTDPHGVHVADRARFGPFKKVEQNTPVGASLVTHLMVIASEASVAEDKLAAATPRNAASGKAAAAAGDDLADLAKSLARTYGWQTTVVAVTAGRDNP